MMAIAAPAAHAQKASDWQTAAGGKMAFEVASIRPSAPNSPHTGNVDLDASDYFRYTGGVVSANGLLVNYLIFAYKVVDASQYPLLQGQLPKWAQTAEYRVEARPAGKPTKDQIRLMMQTLLADRFKLALHMETRQLPVYALVLDKPGKTGPQLQPDPDSGVCTVVPDASKPAVHGSAFPRYCGLMFLTENDGLRHMKIASWTMEQIAGALSTTGASMGGLDPRPMLDQTGLSGKFDISLDFLRESKSPQPTAAGSEPEAPGATFTEALKNQAGLKLLKQTGPVNVLVVDHVEMPSEN
jgi:uncharacterized protein (TIGR03435 family)